MDTIAELERNPASKHQVQSEYGTAETVSRDQILRRKRGQNRMLQVILLTLVLIVCRRMNKMS